MCSGVVKLKVMRTPNFDRSLSLFLLFTLGGLSAAFAQQPAPQPNASSLAAARLAAAQGALRKSYDELGFGAAEKNLLEREVLSEPGAFVTFFDADSVEVNQDKLKGYLRFSAKNLGSPEAGALCAYVRVIAGCAACESLREPLSNDLRARLERRGFRVVNGPFLSDESSLSGEGAFEDYVTRASDARCAGAFYAELQQGDGANAVRGLSFLSVRDSTGKKIKAKAQSMVQIEPGAAVGQFVSGLLQRQLAELFPAAQSLASSANSKGFGNERYLIVRGMTTYPAYFKFKQTVSTGIPELQIEERVISPGVFEFAVRSVRGEADFAALGSRIKGLSWGENQVEVTGMTQNEINLVYR